MTSIPLRRTDAETPWQRVTNWLAVLTLLGLGFVWGPSDAAEAATVLAATPSHGVPYNGAPPSFLTQARAGTP